MAADQSCILFDGGKRIKLLPTVDTKNDGVKFTRDDKGNWDIIIRAHISAEEANKVIFKFNDLDSKGNDFDDTFPNMAFFKAMDDQQQPIFVPITDNSEIFPAFDRNISGAINIKLNLSDFGKTQNPKTQNLEIGH